MALNGKTVHIRIGKGVTFRNLPQKAKKKLYSELTFDNPEYLSAVRHGVWVGSDVPAKLYFFAVSREKDIIWTPRGYIWVMKRWLKQHNYKVKIDDRTLLLPPINFQFKGELRDYQKIAVGDVVRRYPIGVLEAATGSGKTVTAIGIIAMRKQPTLIICHTKELLYQWQEAIKKFLDYECGLIGDGKFVIKDITVGIINTVKNKIDELSNRFGHIIIDECHRAPASTWTETLTEFSAKYFLGLSATVYRNDGLGKAIFVHIGPNTHKVDREMLEDVGAVLKPQIILVKTSYKYGRGFGDEQGVSYASIISDLTKNEARNSFICDTISDDLKQNKQNILVVSDRVSHCEEIAHRLKKMNIKAHTLSGKVNAKDRKEIIEDVRSGKCPVLISTLSLIAEGFDSPNLSALFLVTPIKFSGRLIQIVGRILRPEEGKVPRVYDFRDENVKVLRYSGFARNKIYKSQWG